MRCFQQLLDQFNEQVRLDGFNHSAVSASLYRASFGPMAVGRDRKYRDFAEPGLITQGFNPFNAVEPGHLNVSNYEVMVFGLGHFDPCAAIFGGYNFKAFQFEQPA